MSKHVKYISSEHYGAPQLLGDRWGYGVEMLRKCLCEGFNERIDITDIEVLDKDHVKITYVSPHRYVAYQTIAVKGSGLFELNNEYFIESVTELTVTAKAYIDLTSMLNLKLSELSTVSSKVAPLGFIEKFRDGNKSAFTTDEEKAYFVMDDTQPASWNATGTYTQLISPIVYMTDKMDDINTDGKYIVPFDTGNITAHKSAIGNRNGLWNFITYGVFDYSGNTVANRKINVKYSIIGNGRFFYFIPNIRSYGSGSYIPHIYYFGKLNAIKSDIIINEYVLRGHNVQENGYAYYERLESYCINALSNYTDVYYAINISITGLYDAAILTFNSTTEAITYMPGFNSNINALFISGNGSGGHPDKISGKTHLSKLNIYGVNTGSSYGSFPGLLYVYNINKNFYNNNFIKKMRLNNDIKNIYIIKGNYHSNRHRDTYTTQFIYFISLDYSDWQNYE